MKKQTIKQALVAKGIVRALNGLVGCPVGGWPETAQARSVLRDELPARRDRDYTREELIAHALFEHGGDSSGCGRYQWRPEVARAIDANGL